MREYHIRPMIQEDLDQVMDETGLDPMTGQEEYTMKWHAENVTDS